MAQPKVGDTIQSLIDYGCVRKGEVYEVTSTDGSTITVKTKHGDFYFMAFNQGSTWMLVDCKDILIPIEKPATQAAGFVGSHNLPIDLDWDEYER